MPRCIGCGKAMLRKGRWECSACDHRSGRKRYSQDQRRKRGGSIFTSMFGQYARDRYAEAHGRLSERMYRADLDIEARLYGPRPYVRSSLDPRLGWRFGR